MWKSFLFFHLVLFSHFIIKLLLKSKTQSCPFFNCWNNSRLKFLINCIQGRKKRRMRPFLILIQSTIHTYWYSVRGFSKHSFTCIISFKHSKIIIGWGLLILFYYKWGKWNFMTCPMSHKKETMGLGLSKSFRVWIQHSGSSTTKYASVYKI